MGWYIENLDGYTRSGTQIANFMAHAERNLTPAELRALAPIVNRDGHNPFAFTAREAAAARDVLNDLADRLGKKRLSREARSRGRFARELAAAADTAAKARRPWKWI